MSSREAFLLHNLASLPSRRDIAMLGLIDKIVLGQAHPDFSTFFTLVIDVPDERTRSQTRQHAYGWHDHRNDAQLEIWGQSAFGLISVFNNLESAIAMVDTICEFQRLLQQRLKYTAQRIDMD